MSTPIPYEIRSYHRRRARRLGVRISPSTKASKKLDVFRGSRKVASIGGRGYMDYMAYLRRDGRRVAQRRRALYKKRHQSNRTKPNTPGYYADQILW